MRHRCGSVSIAVMAASVLLGAALLAASQSSRSQRLIEGECARRTLDLALDSAVEEACARLNESGAGGEIALTATPAAFAAEQLALGPVQVQTSGVVPAEVPDGAGGTRPAAVGIVQLETNATWTARGIALRRALRVRRYFHVSMPETGEEPRLEVQSRDLLREVAE